MKKLFGSIVAFGLPVFALAQVQTRVGDINDAIRIFYQYGNVAISILISVAVIFIIYGIVKYAVMGADDEEKRGAAKQQIIWGVIGLAAILSIWGLVRFVTTTINTGPNQAPTSNFPKVQPYNF